MILFEEKTQQPALLQDATGAAAALNLPPAKVGMRLGRYLIILLTGVIGTLASCFMFLAIEAWQAHIQDSSLAGLADNELQAINAGLKDVTDLFYALRAYAESLDNPVSRGEYQRFSESLRRRVPGLRNTGWAPRVTRAGRAAFEHQIQASFLPDFHIMERNANGNLVLAGDRDEYFPVLYAFPDEVSRAIIGFDLLSEPTRSRAIDRAIVTDQPAITPPVSLISMQRPKGGLLSFIPVNFRIQPGSRPSAVAGIVLGAFDTTTMMESILAKRQRLAALNMYVFDPAGAEGNRLIYWHAAGGEPAPQEAAILRGAHWQGTLRLADQQWAAVFTPGGASGTMADWQAIVVLAAGLVLTWAIVAYLWFSLRRTQQLETLTAELRETSSELRLNGAKLEHLARHDVLTGLANRLAFREDVTARLRRVRRGEGLAILYLDLDRFKSVNDTLGHPAGDNLLCQVATRLRETARETDTITRLGGDEFAIAQTDADPPRAAEALAQRLIEALGRPFQIDSHQVAIGVSIGITVADADTLDVDQMIRQADIALYAAKREGRGTSRFFKPVMDHDAQARHVLETDLRHALEHGDFELYYQPHISLATREICGFEALLRWHHPRRGLLMPRDFMRCAEESGLIMGIGRWILDTALLQSTQWPEHWRVAVNISPWQLARDDLADIVEAALLASGQKPARLELEITESALINHFTTGQKTLNRLRTTGVRVALDDFGIGFASLIHLRNAPVDRLKLDQSFVAAMTESDEAAAIVRTMLQFAATFNIATSAEGVETQAQADFLTASGCQEAQGFLFSPATPVSELPRLIAMWPPARVDATQTAAQVG